jgi:glyoxylase-like metal-dependent hydrolase (beta-lactamase superfamily II)
MITLLVPGHNPGPMTGRGTNTYLLPGRVPTLIDAGAGEPAHLAALERTLEESGAASLEQVLVTHAHPDHAGGAAAIRSRWPAAVFRKLPWPARDGRYGSSWTALADGEAVPAGDSMLRAIHTPGHAPDHLCFFDEADRVLFAGDLVVSVGTVVIPASAGGSLQQYLASLRRVLDLAPARLLPGHGPEVKAPVSLITQYIAHRQEREMQIVAVLGEGAATVAAIVERVYVRLNPALTRMAAESVTAHLLKLEAEGRVGRDGATWTLI